jgi:protein phosphatase
MMRVRSAGKTEVGCVRKHNEDNFLLAPDLGLFVVADGLGGHAAGEVASRIVVDKIDQFITHSAEADRTWPVDYDLALSYDGNRLKAALLMADKGIQRDIQDNPERESMGSTVVACLVKGDLATFVHVGDSRAYLLNAEGIRQVTQDHSWVAEQVANGVLTPEEARRHPFRNVITQALGNGGDLEVAIKEVHVAELDRILLCSDGLSSMVQDNEILEIIQNAKDVDEAAEQLVGRAMENGGEDNITVVIVAFDPDPTGSSTSN